MKCKLILASLLMFASSLAYAGQVNVSGTSGFGTLSRTASTTTTVLCGQNLTACGSMSITSQLFTTATSSTFVYSIDYLTGSAGLTFFDLETFPFANVGPQPECWNLAGGFGIVTGETSLSASTVSFGSGVCWFMAFGVDNGAAPLLPGDAITIYADGPVPLPAVSLTGTFGAGNFVIGAGGAITNGDTGLLAPATPEPGTILLLLTGAAGLLIFVRRSAA